MHALRNSLVGKGGAVELELLFHPWLFPTLEYRQEAALDAYVSAEQRTHSSKRRPGVTLQGRL